MSGETISMQIFVATHKDYEFPSDSGYVPLHVGRSLSKSTLPIIGDNTGDHISELNQNFCELTALYWIWKNSDKNMNSIGLVHYRRYFKTIEKQVKLKNQLIASSEDLSSLLENYKVVISKQRNYWIESVEKHYANAHYSRDLDTLKTIVLSKYPDYEKAMNQVLKGSKLSLYNMFLMKREHFEAYCAWLFDVLFEAEKLIPYKEYGPYQKRVFGFLGERLLNVWVNHHFTSKEIKYLPVTNIEGESLLTKGIGLLKRKFQGDKLD
jgi:hypothetical protein